MALIINDATKLLDIITGFDSTNHITKVGLYGSVPDPVNVGSLIQKELGSATSGGAVGKMTITWLTNGLATNDITFYCESGDRIEQVRFYNNAGDFIMYYPFNSSYNFTNGGTFTIDSINLRF